MRCFKHSISLSLLHPHHSYSCRIKTEGGCMKHCTGGRAAEKKDCLEKCDLIGQLTHQREFGAG